MKEEFEAYLNDINVAQPVKNRVDVILKEISSLYEGLVITDIFVCQVKNEEVNYTSLWLFGAGFCIECKDFLSQDDFDLAYLNGNVYYMRFHKINMKQNEVKDNSVLTFSAQISNMSCTLVAVGKNCAYAMDIANKYYYKNSQTYLFWKTMVQ